jgi:hypothetical protein
MSTELLPCPFCGSAARLDPGARGYKASVSCTNEDCGTSNPDFVDVQYKDSAREAVECWNRRAPQAAQAEPELPDDGELEAWRAAADDLLRAGPLHYPSLRRAALLLQNAYTLGCELRKAATSKESSS